MYIRIKELRLNKNLTQKEVANYLNITSHQYSLYETGKIEISFTLLSKLAKLYNTSIDYIVGDTNQLKRH